jgi:hypothetical protein
LFSDPYQPIGRLLAELFRFGKGLDAVQDERMEFDGRQLSDTPYLTPLFPF